MKKRRPFLVLCNDDGIHAEGIQRLWHTLHATNLFDLVIVAPSTQRSGASSSITWTQPILVEKIEWKGGTEAWSVNGNPADCIKMALSVILKKQPDLIVSGINAGSNAGRNVLHSGTVGAVIEGVLRGVPGIAFSSENELEPKFFIAEKYLVTIIKYMLAHPLPEGSFLNVNFPHNVEHDVKGFKMTKQGAGRWTESPYLHMATERGGVYLLGGKPEEKVEDPECDMALLRQGYLTAVPIHVRELTDKETLQKREAEFANFFTLSKIS
jgi:5'-nucleotidase